METSQILINILLYVFLPLWGLAGFVDWLCHRATNIETTSGLFESFLHSLMGIQVAIPIVLCLLFQVNVLILLICILVWISHEVVAHMDVRYASPKRHISIWEMHAHSYLASLPLYMLLMIFVINWGVVEKLFRLEWAGQFALEKVQHSHGFDGYLFYYLVFMLVLCVFPYAEENLRCLKVYFKERS
ncbi:MAG: diguanylate cyclase [Cellvibrionaceae bacterium]